MKIVSFIVILIFCGVAKAQFGEVPPPPAQGFFCSNETLIRNENLGWDGTGFPVAATLFYYSPKSVVFTEGFYSPHTLHAYIGGPCDPQHDVDINGYRKAQVESFSEVTLSPNPNKGIFELFLGQLLNGDILISDAQGRQVYAQSFFETDTVKVDMTGRANGVYFLSLIVADNRVVKRFVKI